MVLVVVIVGNVRNTSFCVLETAVRKLWYNLFGNGIFLYSIPRKVDGVAVKF